jgi:hypothetical protein
MRLGRFLLASTCALVGAHLSAAAQLRGPAPAPPPAPPTTIGMLVPESATTGERDTLMTTRTLSGEVREVNLAEGYIVVADPKQGVGKFYVSNKTRLKADKETPLGDRKKLALEDFQKGQTVKVTFWPNNFRATELRVRRHRN